MNEIRFADGDTSFSFNGDSAEAANIDHFEFTVKQVQEYRKEIEKLSEALQIERKERNQTEREAIDILKRVKDRYDNRLLATHQSYEEQLRSLKETMNNENAKTVEEKNARVIEVESEAKNLRVNRDKLLKELQISNNENNRLLNEVKLLKGEINDLKSNIELNEKERRFQFKERVSELEKERDKLISEISSLKETLKHQETALKASLQNEIISQKTRDFLSKNNIIGLEKWKCYEDCKKENKVLVRKLKELEALSHNFNQIMEEKQKVNSEFNTLQCQMKAAEKDLMTCNEELLKENNKVDELSKRLSISESTIADLQLEVKSLKIALEKKEDALKKLKESSETLKETCANLDSQAQYLETLNEVLQLEKENATKEKQEMTLYSQMLKENVEVLRAEINEERNRNLEMLNKLQFCQESCNKDIENKEQELKNVEEALKYESRTKDSYIQKVDTILEEIRLKNCTIEELHSRIDEVENELMIIKEEAAKQKTMSHNLKVENARLCHALEESLSKYEKSQSRIVDVVNEMDDKEVQFERERLKLQETIHQQLKLIDFLQSKSEKQKKKPWISINSPKNVQTANSANIKEIEAELRSEQRKNQLLIDEIEQTKQELQRCNSTIQRYEQNLDDEINQTIANDIKINNDKTREILKLGGQILSSSPSAPPYFTVHCDDFKTSTTSSLTTDNNDSNSPKLHRVELHESTHQNEFTFSDSMLAELSD